jgi:poly(A) polymerase
MLDYLPEDSGNHIYFESMVSNEASRLALTKLACLLHDVAKPATKALQDDGRARFIGHSNQGADVAREILQRLRFSTNETTYVETLVYNHLRPFQMSSEGLPSARAVYRFFRDTREAGIGTLYLAMADYLACRGPLFLMREWRIVCELVRHIAEEHRRQQAVIAPSKLIDGNELMRALGLKPGPKLGLLLESIREAHAAGAVSSKEEAVELARRAMEEEQR